MVTIKQAAADFLAQERVAVAGVSRNPQGHGSNIVYQRLRDRGYEVFAVNPNADEIEGDRCYPDLGSIPGGVDAVVIGTSQDNAAAVMRDVVAAGVKRVWMHRSFGPGSVSDEATRFGRENGVVVIDGGCPLMFDPTADFGHKCMRPVMSLMGAVPKQVS
jgi:hypothetical protein